LPDGAGDDRRHDLQCLGLGDCLARECSGAVVVSRSSPRDEGGGVAGASLHQPRARFPAAFFGTMFFANPVIALRNVGRRSRPAESW